MFTKKLILFFLGIFSAAYVSAQLGKTGSFVDNSVLRQGKWYKLSVSKSSIYKIKYEDLVQWGVSSPFLSQNFRLFGNGGLMLPEKNSASRIDDLSENYVKIVDGGDGVINSGDYILFYGFGVEQWNYNSSEAAFYPITNLYTDTTNYYFSFDNGVGLRIANYQQPIGNADTVITTYQDFCLHQIDSINLLKSGRLWLGESFGQQQHKVFASIFNNRVPTSDIVFKTSLYSHSSQISSFKVIINNHQFIDSLLPVDNNPTAEYARLKTFFCRINSSSDTINVDYLYNKNEAGADAWLDYFSLQTERFLKYTGNPFNFRHINSTHHAVSKYEIQINGQSPLIWNLQPNHKIFSIDYTLIGNIAAFKSYSDTLQEFVVFEPSHALTPVFVGEVSNQNLHALTYSDLLIVTDKKFVNQAEKIADFHYENDMLNVSIVTTDQIYNEFSSGIKDPTAIRDFVRMIYEKGKNDSIHNLKYLLLLGDGSYDPKNRIENNTNLIPTWQTPSSLIPVSSYVSDDFFGKLDSIEGEDLTGDLDIGVGRLPVTTIEEADIAAEKIIRYGTKKDLQPFSNQNHIVSNYDPWRTHLTFIADDEDGNLHLNQTENLVKLLDSLTHDFAYKKIYLDAFPQIHAANGDKYPDVNKLIDDEVSKGTLMVNYMGHGGEYGLAGEGIITFSEIGKYSNTWNLPVFVTATCEFSRYDNPQLQSAGEKILLNQKGGGIALFTTTRIAFAHSNEIVNRNLLRAMFSEYRQGPVRLGDLVKISKNKCAAAIYMQNFTLLGDPALAVAFPEHSVVSDSVKSMRFGQESDSLLSGSKVTISGRICDNLNNKLSDFSGKLFVKVFDKPTVISTLANDPGLSYSVPISVQDNVLFEGQAKIEDGDFSFDFYTTSDVSYNQGLGKITFYAKSDTKDAFGVADSLPIINDGLSQNFDNKGPDIDIFLEDQNFNPDIPVSSNPILIVHLKDTNGINSYNLGIGHEIMGTTDYSDELYFLNDYYIPNLNDYTSGKVYFDIKNIPVGTHQLKISAWDLLNNKSEKEISFRVTGPTDIHLDQVYNYPEPVVNNYTIFHIEKNHNDSVEELNIVVCDFLGRKCATINKIIEPENIKPIEIYWEPKDSGGNPLSAGLYIFTVYLKNSRGIYTQKSDKMLIIR